ncbi:MAG TPA: phosphotransferase [Candidatus Dormibacteraeota bacterium]|jgi:hypothetical protein
MQRSEDEGLRDRLADFCRAHAGAGAEVVGLRAMPGHSGLSFGFALRGGDGPPRHVLRLPPAGVRGRLLVAPPRAPRLGLRHGDFQWSNLLFHRGRLLAVLDWELASTGPVLHDLGWLCVFSDPGSWEMPGMWSATAPPERLATLYAQHGGEVDALPWHRALAGYAFAVIAAFNLMLHRRGKRVDPHYELLAPSIPRLLERALEVLDGDS